MASLLPFSIIISSQSSSSSSSSSSAARSAGPITSVTSQTSTTTQQPTTASSTPVSSSSAPSSSPSASSSTSASSSSSSNAGSKSVSSSAAAGPTTIPTSFTPTGITTISSGSFVSISTQFVNAPGASATRDVAPSQANTSFFSNKGAVAGVFTVVGLIGAALFIAILTAFIRRRRAKEFDKDVAEAAREAAATSAAHHPFADDDYMSYGSRGSGVGGRGHTGFSAESHGTYDQPAMSHGQGRGGESYVMNDVGVIGGGGHDSRYPTVAAGAAGIGAAVGAVAMQRARSRKENGAGGAGGTGAVPFGDYPMQDRTPYPAFAGPAAGAGAAPQHEMYDLPGGGGAATATATAAGMRYRRGTGGVDPPDLLEAVGLLSGANPGGMGYANTDRPGQEQGRGSDDLQQMHMPTIPARESYIGDGPYHVMYPLPPPNQQQQPRQSPLQQHFDAYSNGSHSPSHTAGVEDPFRRNTMPMPVPVPLPDADAEDAYGGYAEDADASRDGAHHRNESDESRYSDLDGHRASRGLGKARMEEEVQEGRPSFQDEEDYGMQPRVLKVANE